jgi:4-amino-4-deoxy-L-arabinose transferase-like glycosyltransferase
MNGPKRRVLQSCGVILVVSFLLGLAINSLRGERDSADIDEDDRAYHRLAVNLIETGAFGAPGDYAGRAPAYPYFLSIAYRLGSPEDISGRVAQSLLSAINVMLAFLIARFLAGNRAGWIAAAFVLCDSFWWRMQFNLMTENLQGMLLAGSMLALLHAWKNEGLRGTVTTIAAGCLFALSQLAKPNMLPFPLVVAALWPTVPTINRRRAFLRATVFLVTATLIWSPWWLRNYRYFDRFVPFTTGSGHVFFGAHCPANPFLGEWNREGSVMNDPDVVRQCNRLSPKDRELFLDDAQWKAGWKEINRKGWGALTKHEVFKFLRFWSPSTFFSGEEGTWHRWLKYCCISLNCLVLAGFLGSILRRRFENWLCLAFVGSALVTCLIFWGSIRFRYPLAPIICAFSGAYFAEVFSRRFRANGTVKEFGTNR